MHFILHDVTIPLNKIDVSDVIFNSIISGQYEAKEARIAYSLLRQGDRVLELGAGLGIITTVMAKSAGVFIWAFDANPDIVELGRVVLEENGISNVEYNQGLLSAGDSKDHVFYVRRDFWMSSMLEEQGPFDKVVILQSSDIDCFIRSKAINVVVLDIEGAERELLSNASFKGVDRVFLETHDHLYGLAGIRDIFLAMEARGFVYDPRSSSGPCILFRKDDGVIMPYAD
ncbi:FkbM family methyltransferase [Paracoccus liaowanqingii]|uniref:FkbM family methyltransferase n=1 Tax=Paracoccus liaowanqingii TaxID=2560053 RepID=A0A4Z1CR71_9RHOB|nr:FkbM family methyltransferase [Paracoccus liaowanqingii]TGN67630.1 FkbM family methyltransferase [Paracoccus liaowanqingii]